MEQYHTTICSNILPNLTVQVQLKRVRLNVVKFRSNFVPFYANLNHSPKCEHCVFIYIYIYIYIDEGPMYKEFTK